MLCSDIGRQNRVHRPKGSFPDGYILNKDIVTAVELDHGRADAPATKPRAADTAIPKTERNATH